MTILRQNSKIVGSALGFSHDLMSKAVFVEWTPAHDLAYRQVCPLPDW